jgi:glucose/arabinose dehydrogenase
MRSMRRAALVGSAVVVLAVPASAGAVSLVQVGDFTAPTYVTAPPGDTRRVFVVEQRGTIVVLKDTGQRSTFLDIQGLVSSGGERGLLSMAFAPDYATSGRFYVYYTGRAPATERTGDIAIDEFQRDPTNPDAALAATRRRVLRIEHSLQANHNGGQLQLGPDGMLWIATGDGGGAGDPYQNGQNLDSTTAAGRNALLGKLLRVDPRAGGGCGGGCTIPSDNPFAGGGGAPEIWAYGLRNPWRFSFDRRTGDLIVADVGQDAVEEVNFAPANGRGRQANYGWSRYEGNRSYPSGLPAGPPYPPGYVFPVLTHTHSAGWCSITGGYVVRDPALPELAGQYVYSDLCIGRVRAARLAAAGASGDRDLGLPDVSSISTFGEDGCGRVYVASLTGPIYRLASSGACLAQTGSGPDQTPPRVRLAVNHRQRSLRTKVVSLRVTCEEQCSVRLSGSVSVARRGHAYTVPALRLRHIDRKLAANARVRLRLTLSRRVRAAIGRALRARGRARATLRVSARDEAGNRTRRTALIRIVR